MTKLKLLWVDDIRDPEDTRVDWLEYSPIGRDIDIIWVKDYNQYVEYIQTNGLPDGICFDHDLGEDTLTGYDCAKWLIDYCIDNKLKLPKWYCQTANPVGRKNIDSILINYLKYSEMTL